MDKFAADKGDAAAIHARSLKEQGYTKGLRDERDVSYQRPLSLDVTPVRW